MVLRWFLHLYQLPQLSILVTWLLHHICAENNKIYISKQNASLNSRLIHLISPCGCRAGFLTPDLSRPQIPIFPLWININFVFQIALSHNPETNALLSLTFHTEDFSKPYLHYLHYTVLSHLSAASWSKELSLFPWITSVTHKLICLFLPLLFPYPSTQCNTTPWLCSKTAKITT